MSRHNHSARARGPLQVRRKPGELLRQRAAHVARQRVYDAVKRVDRGESVDVRVHGRHVRLSPPSETAPGSTHVLYFDRGRVCFGELSCRDDYHIMRTDTGAPVDPKLRAPVVERARVEFLDGEPPYGRYGGPLRTCSGR